MGNEPLWREGGAILPGARALDADKAWSGAPAANGGAIPRIGALRTALRRLAALRIGPAPAAGDIVALAALSLWAGCALWFALPAPPGPGGAVILALLAALVGVPGLLRRNRPAVMFAAFLLGPALVAGEVAMRAGPVLPVTSTGRVELAGVVERVLPAAGRRHRLLLRLTALPAVAPAYRPRRVRITLIGRRVEGSALPLPGDGVRLRARLRRLPGPVEPGAYDPGRSLWFAGIDAIGHAFVRDLVIATGGCGGNCGWRLVLARRLERWRRAVARSLRHHMDDGPARALARTLLTGARNVLSQDVRDTLRAAGLAHILAISGLHLALVAGAVLWAVRAALALVPALALRLPVRRIAAVAALLAALAYMLLSGNSVATRRAFIMLAVMTLAAVLERPAVTMRNLGLAALVLLLVTPHVAVSAGFQMSFLAVMGLIAVWEAWQHARRRAPEGIIAGGGHQAATWRLARSAFAGLAALIVSSLVAAAMTALPAVWHFQRLAPWGLFGNLLALPLLSLLVMPAGLLALALMPLGLEGPLLWIMERGLEAILWWSGRVAALPGALHALAAPSLPAVLLAAAGLALLALRRDALRFAGLLPLCAAVLWPAAPRPDLLVDDRAAIVAVRDAAGRLVPVPGRGGDFALRAWLRRDGDAVTTAAARRRPGWACEGGVCRFAAGLRRVVYLTHRAEPGRQGRRGFSHNGRRRSERAKGTARAVSPAVACRDADIVVAAFPLRGLCARAPVRIDRFDVWRHGAHAVHWRKGREGRSSPPFVRRALAEPRPPWHPPPRPRRAVIRATPSAAAP